MLWPPEFNLTHYHLNQNHPNKHMKSTHKRLLLLTLISALSALFGASCNTVRGVGRDVERAGNGIQKSTR